MRLQDRVGLLLCLSLCVLDLEDAGWKKLEVRGIEYGLPETIPSSRFLLGVGSTTARPLRWKKLRCHVQAEGSSAKRRRHLEPNGEFDRVGIG